MPQTREAVAHARAARVPIVVALSKIDKSNANPDKVKQELAEIELVPDEWDGDTLVVPIAAKTVEEAEGIEDLLEAVLLVADEMEIKANPEGDAAGTVLEAEIDKSRGVMTTLLVQNGTLRVGGVVLAGNAYGRVKAMFNEHGDKIDEAQPSTPVLMMGLSDVPQAGTLFVTAPSEKKARVEAEARAEATKVSPAGPVRATTLEELYAQFEAGETNHLNLIVKADVQGSLAPIVNSLEPLREGDIAVNILHAETGAITESDITLASASNATVIGFQVDVDNAARRMADTEKVEIRTYKIIYKLIEDVEKALEGQLEPVYEDVVIGVAEVRQVFRIPKVGNVAGSFIRQGEARRNAKARVVRAGEVLHQSGVSSLKRFEEDVREVREGFECGISIDGFKNFKEGDLIEFLVQERVN
jgi:translation initiation factor IF-2